MKRLVPVLGLFCLSFVAVPLMAQPFGSYLSIPSGEGYIAIPHSSDFDFTTGWTFEAWVSVRDSGACSNIFGNQYTTAQWVGICGTTLRSYDRGTSSIYDAGNVPPSAPTHLPITSTAPHR